MCTGLHEAAITSEPQCFIPAPVQHPANVGWLWRPVRDEDSLLSVLQELRAKFTGNRNRAAKLMLPLGSAVPSCMGGCRSLGRHRKWSSASLIL